MSGVFSIASHSAEQYFPSVTMQLQTGCAHFLASAIFVLPPRPSYQLSPSPPIPLPMQAPGSPGTALLECGGSAAAFSLPTPKPISPSRKNEHLSSPRRPQYPANPTPHPTPFVYSDT